MAEEQVFRPIEIADNPFPFEESMGTNTSNPTGDGEKAYTSEKIKDNPFPQKVTARELISTTLNTKSKKILASFEFTESGALQIGKYDNGVSGDIKISPSGIVARNQSGETTFALDGDTGDATFRGEVSAGSFVGGTLYLGSVGGSVYIDGANQQIIVNDGQNDRIIIGYQKDGF